MTVVYRDWGGSLELLLKIATVLTELLYYTRPGNRVHYRNVCCRANPNATRPALQFSCAGPFSPFIREA